MSTTKEKPLNTKRISVRVPDDLHFRFNLAARRKRTTMSEVLERAAIAFTEEVEREEEARR